MGMLQKIKTFFAEDRLYCASCAASITEHNNTMLKDGCIVYAAVLTFYTIITGIAGNSEDLFRMYCVFDVIHAVLCAVTFIGFKSPNTKQGLMAALCIALELSVLGFFSIEGAMASRTEHSLYIPIAILLVMLLFIHRLEYTITVSTVYVLVFGVISALHKTEAAAINDHYIALATYFSSLIGCFLIAKMRHAEGFALNRYTSLSKTDQLTKLYNKPTMEELCGHIISEPNRRCAFFVVDIDDFKAINDTYGHDFGDVVLIHVGQRIQECFRETDLVGRFGGDEFLVLMDRCDDLALVRSKAERIIQQVGCLSLQNAELPVQCSIGVTLKKDADSFSSVFRRADQALYSAKKSGKGQYHIE